MRKQMFIIKHPFLFCFKLFSFIYSLMFMLSCQSMICHLHAHILSFDPSFCSVVLLSFSHFTSLHPALKHTHTHTHTHNSQAIQEEISSRESEVNHLESVSQSLTPLSCTADRNWLSERMGAVRSNHSELTDWCSRRAGMLEQALANAQLFGEEEVEVLNWLAEVAQRLAQVSVQSYQHQLLAEQHKHTLVRPHALSESLVLLPKHGSSI